VNGSWRTRGTLPHPQHANKIMIDIERVYDDYLYDCYIANKRLSLEDWAYYGKEKHHVETPNRDGGLLTPCNSQDLTTYQHWVAGVLQSEVLQKLCFAHLPRGIFTGLLEELRVKWKSLGVSGENHPLYGKHHSEETRRKISDAQKGENHPNYGKVGELAPFYGRKHTEETLQKMSDANKGENNPNYGKKMSEESRRKMSDANKGENNPNYGKVGELSPNYGRKNTEETLQKMSDAHKGANNPNYGKVGELSHRYGEKHTEDARQKMCRSPIILVHPDGFEEYFKGITRACEIYGLDRNSLRMVCKGISRQHKGYKARYAD
jgi:hypothetical protein